MPVVLEPTRPPSRTFKLSNKYQGNPTVVAVPSRADEHLLFSPISPLPRTNPINAGKIRKARKKWLRVKQWAVIPHVFLSSSLLSLFYSPFSIFRVLKISYCIEMSNDVCPSKKIRGFFFLVVAILLTPNSPKHTPREKAAHDRRPGTVTWPKQPGRWIGAVCAPRSGVCGWLRAAVYDALPELPRTRKG